MRNAELGKQNTMSKRKAKVKISEAAPVTARIEPPLEPQLERSPVSPPSSAPDLFLRNSPRWAYVTELYLGTDLIESNPVPRPPLSEPGAYVAPFIDRKGVRYHLTGQVGNAIQFRF